MESSWQKYKGLALTSAKTGYFHTSLSLLEEDKELN